MRSPADQTPGRRPRRDYDSPVTGAFVQEFEPIRIYLYDPSPYPREVLNPLARLLLFDDPRYFEGRFLFERVADPEAAYLLLFPCDLNYFEGREERVFGHLPYYPRLRDRHLFFDHRDTTAVFPSPASFCLKVSVHRRQVGSRVLCIPYMEMVDNFLAYLHQERRLEYLLSFIGEWSELRAALISRLVRRVQPSYLRLRRAFFHQGYLQHPGVERQREWQDPAAKRSLRRHFLEVTLLSKFVLCLPGYGLNSFRFFEALSLGVPPILVADDCALPWEGIVDYDRFCARISPRDAVGERIEEVVAGTGSARYGEMCRLGRLHYDAYLSPRNFLFLLYRSLAAALSKEAADLGDANREESGWCEPVEAARVVEG